jgi:hypothetical protein
MPRGLDLLLHAGDAARDDLPQHVGAGDLADLPLAERRRQGVEALDGREREPEGRVDHGIHRNTSLTMFTILNFVQDRFLHPTVVTMSTSHVSVRLDAQTMARVDALGPLFSTRWRRATRSDILRGLILEALTRLEREGPTPEGSAGPSATASTPARRKRRKSGPREG